MAKLPSVFLEREQRLKVGSEGPVEAAVAGGSGWKVGAPTRLFPVFQSSQGLAFSSFYRLKP